MISRLVSKTCFQEREGVKKLTKELDQHPDSNQDLQLLQLFPQDR